MEPFLSTMQRGMAAWQNHCQEYLAESACKVSPVLAQEWTDELDRVIFIRMKLAEDAATS